MGKGQHRNSNGAMTTPVRRGRWASIPIAIAIRASLPPFTPPTGAARAAWGSGKSTNGGVDWARCGDVPIENQDVYSIDIDPYDSQHLIIGYHEEMGLSESSDGCATWKGLPAAPTPAIST